MEGKNKSLREKIIACLEDGGTGTLEGIAKKTGSPLREVTIIAHEYWNSGQSSPKRTYSAPKKRTLPDHSTPKRRYYYYHTSGGIKRLDERATRRGFEDYRELGRHLAEERINPETGEPFCSETAYNNFRRIQREGRLKNQVYARWLREKLGELGMTQRALSRRVGISAQTVSEYIHGSVYPRIPTKRAIRNVLKGTLRRKKA